MVAGPRHALGAETPEDPAISPPNAARPLGVANTSERRRQEQDAGHRTRPRRASHPSSHARVGAQRREPDHDELLPRPPMPCSASGRNSPLLRHAEHGIGAHKAIPDERFGSWRGPSPRTSTHQATAHIPTQHPLAPHPDAPGHRPHLDATPLCSTSRRNSPLLRHAEHGIGAHKAIPNQRFGS